MRLDWRQTTIDDRVDEAVAEWTETRASLSKLINSSQLIRGIVNSFYFLCD